HLSSIGGEGSGAGVSPTVGPGFLAVAAPFRGAPAAVARVRAVIEHPTAFTGIARLEPFELAAVPEPEEFGQDIAKTARRPPFDRPQIDRSVSGSGDF